MIQESFTVAFASLPRLERPQTFASWLATIVTGTTIAALRRRLLARFGLLRREPVQIEALIARTAPPDVRAVSRRRSTYPSMSRPSPTSTPLLHHLTAALLPWD